jgi:hypothetical protein
MLDGFHPESIRGRYSIALYKVVQSSVVSKVAAVWGLRRHGMCGGHSKELETFYILNFCY